MQKNYAVRKKVIEWQTVMTKVKKLHQRSGATDPFTLASIGTILREVELIDDAIFSEMTRREREQRELLQKNDPTAIITPIDVITSLNIIPSSSQGGGLTEEEIMQTLASYWNLPFLKIDSSRLKASTITSRLSEPFARKHLIIPLLPSKTMLLVAVMNPWDVEALDAVQQASNLEIRPVVSTKSDILKAIEKCYGLKNGIQKEKKEHANFLSSVSAATKTLTENHLVKAASDASGEIDGQQSEKHVVNAVNALLQYAFEHHASDIHIEPKNAGSIIRLRIDGMLHEFERIPQDVHNSFILRIKALAGMHITEKRKPLDGRFQMKYGTRDVEFRISTMPVAFGEKMVIRILDSRMLLKSLDTLGFSPHDLEKYLGCISRSNGIILITGPTGSGKTTTIYSTLYQMAEQQINITTVEDPVELVHEKFNQIAVQPGVGLTFDTAIRHIVRQSPDVIMVGEIRDENTGKNAFKAALTGHLVMSTMHTNDAPSTILRLTDMGAQPSLIESTLIAVVTQRLVRKVCDNCGESYTPAEKELKRLFLAREELEGLPIRKGIGCRKCRGTGYYGRTGIFEIMKMSDGLRALIHKNAAVHILKSLAIKEGMQTLRGSAIAKFKAGITTSEEVLRITGGAL